MSACPRVIDVSKPKGADIVGACGNVVHVYRHDF